MKLAMSVTPTKFGGTACLRFEAPLRISVNACRQSGLRTTIMHMTADTRFVFDIVRACVYKQTGFMLLQAFQSHSRTSSTTEISCVPRHRGGIAA